MSLVSARLRALVACVVAGGGAGCLFAPAPPAGSGGDGGPRDGGASDGGPPVPACTTGVFTHALVVEDTTTGDRDWLVRAGSCGGQPYLLVSEPAAAGATFSLRDAREVAVVPAPGDVRALGRGGPDEVVVLVATSDRVTVVAVPLRGTSAPRVLVDGTATLADEAAFVAATPDLARVVFGVSSTLWSASTSSVGPVAPMSPLPGDPGLILAVGPGRNLAPGFALAASQEDRWLAPDATMLPDAANGACACTRVAGTAGGRRAAGLQLHTLAVRLDGQRAYVSRDEMSITTTNSAIAAPGGLEITAAAIGAPVGASASLAMLTSAGMLIAGPIVPGVDIAAANLSSLAQATPPPAVDWLLLVGQFAEGPPRAYGFTRTAGAAPTPGEVLCADLELAKSPGVIRPCDP